MHATKMAKTRVIVSQMFLQEYHIMFIYIPYRPMYIDSTNETEPSGELPVAKLLQTNIEPLLKVKPFFPP